MVGKGNFKYFPSQHLKRHSLDYNYLIILKDCDPFFNLEPELTRSTFFQCQLRVTSYKPSPLHLSATAKSFFATILVFFFPKTIAKTI